jgi:actin-related protein 6
MTNERISIPELLFHPSDIGLNQGGIIESIIQSVSACDSTLHGLLYENIICVGGNTLFTNFIERM